MRPQAESIRVRAQDNFIAQSIDLHVIREDFTQRPVVVESLVQTLGGDYDFRQIEEGTLLPTAPFRLRRENAQQLMDDLYRAGLRPADAKGTAGQLEATQSHLEDMRRAYEVILAGAR